VFRSRLDKSIDEAVTAVAVVVDLLLKLLSEDARRYAPGMAINAWWLPEPRQRFWMEATRRDDLGNALRAPVGGIEDQPVWNYELVTFAEPGDIVFHWHTALVGRPAIVGWSTIIGPQYEGDFEWSPAGGANKDVVLPPRPHYVMPLGGLHWLPRPITIDDLTTIRGGVIACRLELEARIKGPSYFPFNKYGVDGIRAMQGYFTKFPAELVDILQEHFELDVADPPLLSQEEDGASPHVAAAKNRGGQGRLADTARLIVTEHYAEDRAIAFYESLGATQIEKQGAPYDIRMKLDGRDLRVEVKGSSGALSKVLVTKNEVSHAHKFEHVELFVVDQIMLTWTDKEMVASGGRVRRWPIWKPTPESLKALTYEHTLGDDWLQVD